MLAFHDLTLSGTFRCCAGSRTGGSRYNSAAWRSHCLPLRAYWRLTYPAAYPSVCWFVSSGLLFGWTGCVPPCLPSIPNRSRRVHEKQNATGGGDSKIACRNAAARAYGGKRQKAPLLCRCWFMKAGLMTATRCQFLPSTLTFRLPGGSFPNPHTIPPTTPPPPHPSPPPHLWRAKA